jgi:dTDP-4-amino-4,6-dideoxygalactose transaminase
VKLYIILKAITSRTKAIIPVHMYGHPADMNSVMEIATEKNLFVIEDAAQACLSTYKGRQLGTIGDLGCFSFHETKNIISGEGGALLVNNNNMIVGSVNIILIRHTILLLKSSSILMNTIKNATFGLLEFYCIH